MKNWPWLSLFLAIMHTLAGVAVLIVSSWFIAACAIASVNFNYMLPAVVIRALALLRIASGYGQMWLGHRDLLTRTGRLRLQLFRRLQNKRMAERTWLIEALANHTETIASVWVAWVAQQAGAIAMLAVGMICSLWLGLQGAYGLYWLAAVWLALTVYTLYRGIQLAAAEADGERGFRFASEHFLAASSLWHILLTREAGQYRLRGAPSARPLWQIKPGAATGCRAGCVAPGRGQFCLCLAGVSRSGGFGFGAAAGADYSSFIAVCARVAGPGAHQYAGL